MQFLLVLNLHFTTQKMKFSIEDLVTFTGEILKGYVRYKTTFGHKVALDV